MSENLVIQSHKGPYSVVFDNESLANLNSAVPDSAHFIIDEKVARLYADELNNVLASPSVLLVEALETNKSLDKFTGYVEDLVANGIRRGHILVAIGGGIIQDITCFLAATLFRGVDWHFYPTTLLAQADSCIGSKSSINVGKLKNMLGTFTPPAKIFVATHVLRTLEPRDVRSGVGEMLKVHVIDGPDSFDQIAADYSRLFTDESVMEAYILRSLEIKKRVIEVDEFDKGVRNVMNYGHSFGHAIESATEFAIPHGVAISIGADMANYTAMRMGYTSTHHYERMHPILVANYRGFEQVAIPAKAFLDSIAKDKKNTTTHLRLILPDEESRVAPDLYPNDDNFRAICTEYLTEVLPS